MGENIGASDKRALAVTPSRTALGPSAAGWARVALGVGLAGTVGLSLLAPDREGARWLLAVFGFSAGLVLVSSGLGILLSKAGAEHSVPAPRSDAPVPSLGEFLVGECGLITPEDLARALARQGETGRPLGETVLEMGLITSDDLKRVLRVHWGLRDLWRDSSEEN